MHRDDFTSTVDGAAAFERAHGEQAYNDRPTLADVADDTPPARLSPERAAALRAEDPWSAPAVQWQTDPPF
jgi:hypothetical protein